MRVKENEDSLSGLSDWPSIGERSTAGCRMIAYICHDLRTPLAAILANAEFLAQPGIGDMQRIEISREIEGSAVQMNELISSLLECSKAPDSFRPSVGNIVDIVEHAIRTIGIRSEFRSIAIKRRHIGRTVGWFDSSLLERAISNLVRNACEAVSPESGQIVITTIGDPSHIQIDVWDNGPGVPLSIRNLVFRPFVSYGKAEGNGLGLTIAKDLVEQHGGEIRLEGDELTGTLFKITIPDAIFPVNATPCVSLDVRKCLSFPRRPSASSLNVLDFPS